MKKIVMLRHGQSQWNKENRFTGWVDVPLSPLGEEEAKQAGQRLKKAGFKFDLAFTSLLKRADQTLSIVLAQMGQQGIPIERSWRLNERHYGALQGLNKKETAEKHGDEQVHIWRRSYKTRPPAYDTGDTNNPATDERYNDLKERPQTESLEDTVKRAVPYWESEIWPKVSQGKHIIIAAHGNSIRALLKHIEKISDEAITEVNIPTGIPLVFELGDDGAFIKKYYLE